MLYIMKFQVGKAHILQSSKLLYKTTRIFLMLSVKRSKLYIIIVKFTDNYNKHKSVLSKCNNDSYERFAFLG
jgi:hypothetical protein